MGSVQTIFSDENSLKNSNYDDDAEEESNS